jgi:threonine/homoserine/homoserine lactone efflux protein
MINSEKVILFISLSTIFCLAPGPSMLFAITQGLSGDRGRALFGVGGTVTGNIIWVTTCAFGVGRIIKDSQYLFSILRYLGAAYLLYMGILVLKNSKNFDLDINDNGKSSYISVYFQGLLTTISNPKALLYYLSFLPQFVSGQINYGLEIFYWGIAYVCIVILVMGSYALTANRIISLVKNSKFCIFSKQLVGIGFIGASISVLRNK